MSHHDKQQQFRDAIANVASDAMTRRQFLTNTSLVAGAGVLGWCATPSTVWAGTAPTAVAARASSPVVTIWMGLPELDMTGLGKPYIPAKSCARFESHAGDMVTHPAWDCLW